MKYYSDKTKKIYDDVKSLEAAEKEYDNSHEVETNIKKAWNDVEVALKKYNDLVKQNDKNKREKLDFNEEELNILDKLIELFL